MVERILDLDGGLTGDARSTPYSALPSTAVEGYKNYIPRVKTQAQKL
jgi:hypothetical protein